MRPFGRLLTTYTVNEIGDAVGVVALAVLVYDRTEAVAPTAAIFIAAKFLPALIAPLLTARVDQLPLRRILPLLYVIEAAAFAALGFIADSDFLLGLVLALALVDGTLAITGRGLTRGAVAAVLQPAGLLREGNAMMNVGFAVASVGGAALAGLLIGTVGIATAFYVDAASFLVIAALLAATRNLPAVEVSHEPFRERFSAGLRYARDASPGAAAADRPGGRARALHADHPDRGHLREGEPRHDVGRLRRPAGLLGRRHLRREPALPADQEPVARGCSWWPRPSRSPSPTSGSPSPARCSSPA